MIARAQSRCCAWHELTARERVWLDDNRLPAPASLMIGASPPDARHAHNAR